jgi:hypothetical protein
MLVQHSERVCESKATSASLPLAAAARLNGPSSAGPAKTGHTSAAALSQTVKTKSSGGALGWENFNQLLERALLTS